MPNYALVDPQDQIDRIAANVDPTVQTKAGWRWLPVADTAAPAYVPELETLASESVVLDGAVTQAWTVVRRSVLEQKSAIKTEARRRILARFPEWKQSNMTARGVELLRKGEASWSAEEAGEAAALQAAWDWVKAVRRASDVLEALEPMPLNFAADTHWPA